MLAAVTDLDGTITGVHRTWLARDGSGKAPVATPRRAIGRLLGHGVRFSLVKDVVAVGEGIETMLALRCVLPALPMIAALSANHLAAQVLPAGLRRLYIATDNDDAGMQAGSALIDRAAGREIEAVMLTPLTGDFNDDLRQLQEVGLAANLRSRIARHDAIAFRIGVGPSHTGQ